MRKEDIAFVSKCDSSHFFTSNDVCKERSGNIITISGRTQMNLESSGQLVFPLIDNNRGTDCLCRAYTDGEASLSRVEHARSRVPYFAVNCTSTRPCRVITCVVDLSPNWCRADERKTLASGENRSAPRQQCSTKEQENKPATKHAFEREMKSMMSDATNIDCITLERLHPFNGSSVAIAVDASITIEGAMTPAVRQNYLPSTTLPCKHARPKTSVLSYLHSGHCWSSPGIGSGIAKGGA